MLWPWNSFDILNAKLDRITAELSFLIKQESRLMSALTDLQASQAALATAVAAAIADIQALAAKLAAPGTSDADVEAVVAQLNTLATNLQAAVSANPSP